MNLIALENHIGNWRIIALCTVQNLIGHQLRFLVVYMYFMCHFFLYGRYENNLKVHVKQMKLFFTFIFKGIGWAAEIWRQSKFDWVCPMVKFFNFSCFWNIHILIILISLLITRQQSCGKVCFQSCLSVSLFVPVQGPASADPGLCQLDPASEDKRCRRSKAE